MGAKRVGWVALILAGLTVGRAVWADDAATAPAPVLGTVTFSGGHETEGRDRGRPDVLVAAGLGVPTQVFRDAFSHVHPAGRGSGPTDAEARANKQALMSVLGPYGVTDDKLNEVSNRYRYRKESGKLWTHKEAAATATMVDGKVTGFVIQDGGYGYSSTPEVKVEGFPNLQVKVTLKFGTDLETNGSVEKMELVGAGGAGTQP